MMEVTCDIGDYYFTHDNAQHQAMLQPLKVAVQWNLSFKGTSLYKTCLVQKVEEMKRRLQMNNQE